MAAREARLFASDALDRVEAGEGGEQEMRALRRLIEAVQVVRATNDLETADVPGQSPVEDWAMAALDAAYAGQVDRAEAIMDRFGDVPWSEYEGESPAGLFRCQYDAALESEHEAGRHRDHAVPACLDCPGPEVG